VYRIIGSARSAPTLLTAPYRLHRFNVRDLDRMLEIGILADVQRHELLDGVVLDLDVDAQARAARVAADVAARLPPLKALLEEREVSR